MTPHPRPPDDRDETDRLSPPVRAALQAFVLLSAAVVIVIVLRLT